MYKYLVNPTDFIHFVIQNVPKKEFGGQYDLIETELFKYDLYPAGYKSYFNKDIATNKDMSSLLSAGILKFLSENNVEEFYLDENE